MKVIDKYLLKRFLLLLAVCIISCQTIFVFVDLVGNLNRYLNVSVRYIALYYLYLLPYITAMVFPIAMLLAAMFTTGVLSMNNELSAMRAAGISTFRFSAPLFIMSAVICVFILLFSETLLPIAHKKKTYILNYKLANKKPPSYVVKKNFYYQGKHNTMYRFGVFNGKTNCGKNVIIEKYNVHRMTTRIKADSMIWKTGQWMLRNGVSMKFTGSSMKMKKFSFLSDSELVDKPNDFLVVKKTPDDMNYFELKKYIDQVRRSGGKAHQYLADLYFKISYPLINLIVVLLGVSLTTKVERRGLTKVFGVGLGICFTYYMFAKLGLAFGHSGDMLPLLAAWIGNLVFFAVGIFLFVRVSR